MGPILKDLFYHDGRGPELIQVHYGSRGTKLLAVDYSNPPGQDSASIRHLVFARSQTFMFTPEEVESGGASYFGEHVAAYCLDQSQWLRAFSPSHLAQCSHYRFMFYDEYLDVICEGVESRPGKYAVA